MKTFTHEYNSKRLLESFIDDNYINNYTGEILIQVFSSMNDKEYLLYLKDELLHFFPDAKIIGTTTNGEISQNGAIDHSTVLSISVFETTKIVTTMIDNQDDSFHKGIDIINELDKDNLKLLITFIDGLNTNGEEYLNGISSINDNVIVSGAMAGDYSKYEETLVFTENGITNKGAVAAAFYNEKLHIHTNYSFNWETVGKTHIIEKAYKNRVYQISGMTALDFYKYYLGNDIEQILPAIAVEFPLVFELDDVKTARAVLSKHDDGSLSFAGNIEEGTKVQFGHGDVQLIIERGLENIKDILKSPIESIFIYSCIARKTLLQDDINLEILPLKKIAPISGFFAFGEFYHKANCEHSNAKLLNQSMSILTISENDREIDRIDPDLFNEHTIGEEDLTLHRTQAFSSLIKRTTKELEDLNENLHKKVQEEITLNLEKDNMLTLLHTQAQLGSTLEMILHQWRQPISAITSTLSSVEVYKDAEILTDEILEQNLNNIMEYTEHLNRTIEDFRDLFKNTDTNTDIKIDDLITKSLTIIKPILLENRINIDIKIDIDNVISIPVGLVMQVILNIVKNAIDILNQTKTDNPIITIKAYTQTDTNIIEISDNGGGIPSEVLPKIFEKSFTTKTESDGTGIGLHMSKKIIETKVKGSLKAHNDSANRAVFTITIPK